VIADRKDDHVRFAVEQHRDLGGYNQFDDVSFVHHALAGAEVSLATRFGGIDWRFPLYIDAMTGGSPRTGLINRDLAIAARETGVPIATGSMSAYFADASVAEPFSVMRRENPDGFIMANINATASVDNARRAIDLMRADALQIHLNTIQETVMPEGDRSFASWGPRIEQIVAGVDVPVIVMEVALRAQPRNPGAVARHGCAGGRRLRPRRHELRAYREHVRAGRPDETPDDY